MSLILEALKKVEREKQARDTGLVVVGATAWPAARRPWWPMAAALAGTAALGAAVAAFMLRPSAAPAAVARPAASSIVPSATTLGALESPVVAIPPALAPPPTLALPPSEQKAEVVKVAPLRRPVTATAAAPRPKSAAPSSAAEFPEPAPRAPAVRGPRPPALRLQAISEQDGQPVAMLNDRLVREGEVVDGARVVHIGADSVEVEISGRKHVLRF